LIKGEKREAGFFPLGKRGETIGWRLSPFGKGGQGDFVSNFLEDIISPIFS
jgi:hypothetical protein